MVARLHDLTIGLDGKQLLTVEIDTDFRADYDVLKDEALEVTIKKSHRKRSLTANAYAWVLIDKLADALCITRGEVYREAIRNIGGVSETVCVRDIAVDRLVNGWRHNGLGWFAETSESKLKGCTNVTLYYGSSVYDSHQMSALIDALVLDCKQCGIETMPPAEIRSLLEEERTHGRQHD